MKTVFIVFFLALASANVVPHRFDAACNNVQPTSTFDGCYVDLTIAMDMSSAMGNTANIATMTNSILTDFLPNFNFYETFTAGLSFGSTVTSSMYWDNYADMCNYIHSAEEQATQVGLNYTRLSEVFQNYQIDLQHSGRNYQKVLVLLTAKSDQREITAAKVFADQIMANGVAIIIVALAQDSTSPLSQLGQHFYSTPGYTIPITTIPSVICSYGGQTMIPPTVNPSGPPYDPLSDAVGTPCSTNIANIWLDIVFVVDVGSAMSKTDLNNWQLETRGYMNNVSFGTRGPHKTRAGIITYATDPVTRLALKDGISKTTFQSEALKVPKYLSDDDNGGDIQKALKAAEAMLNETWTLDGKPRDIRQRVIILSAAAFDVTSSQNVLQTAKTLKDDGIKIFTINSKTSAGVYVSGLDDLATQGYAYRSDMALADVLPLGLTQVNCFCPVGSTQFVHYNGHNNTNYADCIVFNDAPSLPSLILPGGCLDGVVLSVTSQAKLDFVTDQVLANSSIIGKNKKILVGLYKDDDGNWYWSGYDQTKYPLGSYPVFNPAPGDSFSIMNNYFGLNWNFLGITDAKEYPFLCQNRACDADFICDQS